MHSTNQSSSGITARCPQAAFQTPLASASTFRQLNGSQELQPCRCDRCLRFCARGAVTGAELTEALRAFTRRSTRGRMAWTAPAPYSRALGLTVADATAGGGQLAAGQVRQTGRAAEAAPATGLPPQEPGRRARPGPRRRWPRVRILAGRPLEGATLAAYLPDLHDQVRAPASAADHGGCGVLPGPPSPANRGPAGEPTARILAGYRPPPAGRRPGPPPGRAGKAWSTGAASTSPISSPELPLRKGRGTAVDALAGPRPLVVEFGAPPTAGCRESDLNGPVDTCNLRA